ncbi:hypothetical protein ZIOFF_048140 [Zingiber officinale]|uniref:Uncharacterized protein n=1 Tax=Zingiber officinale TaxID=94328 RepID=A0A8J5FQS4_ZINOF|nr:hypothetical protein ZIOFF_048140 [Zingiber officinale]
MTGRGLSSVERRREGFCDVLVVLSTRMSCDLRWFQLVLDDASQFLSDSVVSGFCVDLTRTCSALRIAVSFGFVLVSVVSFDLAMILVNDLVASNVNLRWFLLLVMVSDSMNINVDFVMVSSYGVPILLLMMYMMEVRETPPRILWRTCIRSRRGGEMVLRHTARGPLGVS